MKYQSGGDRQELSTDSNFRVDISKHGEPDAKKRKQFKKDQKIEEERIRSMKRSHDYREWASLSNEIDRKFWELAELKEKERQLEDKLIQVYNIQIYTKYGLFRSRKYDNIC
jgi:hypothetical protein